MKVTELNRSQLIQLKQDYLSVQYDAEQLTPSTGELAWADDIVSDDEVFAFYEGIDFTEDDFS